MIQRQWPGGDKTGQELALQSNKILREEKEGGVGQGADA
jgi:hypothetical protein